ncbi:MAG: hypothetical protein MZW92_63925 [Comamonadaceae bacterium]|nr:hypothetical protein [Comamonadaceae bacterium]
MVGVPCPSGRRASTTMTARCAALRAPAARPLRPAGARGGRALHLRRRDAALRGAARRRTRAGRVDADPRRS